MPADRSLARRLAHESLEQGDALGWFETLYQRASGDESSVPWADLTANPGMVEWLRRKPVDAAGQRALVVGCGLGDDAEALAALGFRVTAFDISATAVEWCRRRFAASHAEYRLADLFSAPADWRGAFDFVFEAYTLQVLPAELRPQAAAQIAEFVAPGGTALIIARGRDGDDDPGQMPWPLLREELDRFAESGLALVRFEDYVDDEDPPVRRFRAEYRRPGVSD